MFLIFFFFIEVREIIFFNNPYLKKIIDEDLALENLKEGVCGEQEKREKNIENLLIVFCSKLMMFLFKLLPFSLCIFLFPYVQPLTDPAILVSSTIISAIKQQIGHQAPNGFGPKYSPQGFTNIFRIAYAWK